MNQNVTEETIKKVEGEKNKREKFKKILLSIFKILLSI